MKVSLNWLQQYVEIDTEPSALAETLTMAGLEVEAVIDPYADLATVVVGHITDVVPHPDADKLSVCTVDIGSGHPIAVVCGAANAKTGIFAPCAMPGTVLPSGAAVEKGKIRGQISEGMLCSEAELELGPDADGLMALDADVQPGVP
ncbi:MAG: YtpR family tRNA-binding protein, partial [Thermodesulfobacteriota bacterium]